MSPDASRAFYNICGGILFLSVSAFLVFGIFQTREVAVAAKSYYEELAANQERIHENVRYAGEVASDILAYAVARGLEQTSTLSPTVANAIAGEALENISARSERWGEIAEAINDQLLLEQRGIQ